MSRRLDIFIWEGGGDILSIFPFEMDIQIIIKRILPVDLLFHILYPAQMSPHLIILFSDF